MQPAKLPYALEEVMFYLDRLRLDVAIAVAVGVAVCCCRVAVLFLARCCRCYCHFCCCVNCCEGNLDVMRARGPTRNNDACSQSGVSTIVNTPPTIK